jgi:hypothetical protein
LRRAVVADVREGPPRIYCKIDVANRAQASVFAMRHGLMSDAPAPDRA